MTPDHDTARKSLVSERAERIADAIKSGELAMVYCHEGLGAIDMPEDQRGMVENALRRLAAQDQKPVAWRYRPKNGRYHKRQPEWLATTHYSHIEAIEPYADIEPLYLQPVNIPSSPQPAADLGQAVSIFEQIYAPVEYRWAACWGIYDTGSICGLGPTPEAAKADLVANYDKPPLPPHGGADAGVRKTAPYNIKAIATVISLSYGEDPEADAELGRMCTADNKPVKCWEVYEEQAKALFAWLNAVLDSLSHQPAPVAAEDEAYELGKCYGYEDAIQDLDIATGGDGEFKGSTISGETVDVETMKQRIVERFANASAEARLREALEKIIAIKNQEYGGDWDEIELARAIALEALSAHPHASDCDNPIPEGLQKAIDDTRAAMDRELSSLPKLVCPSDSTTDVTLAELTEWVANEESRWDGAKAFARALLDAFTVGKRLCDNDAWDVVRKVFDADSIRSARDGGAET